MSIYYFKQDDFSILTDVFASLASVWIHNCRVHRLLKTIDEKKSVGLDKIPNKLLKMAADVIAPSLREIFAKSIHTGIFPYEWKEAMVSPVY